MKVKKILRTNSPEVIFLLLAFCFSFWLMTKTFGYDQKTGEILIARKAWSDFAYRLPLIRSFSWGSNFPPQDPLFPGKIIHYHFLFYFLVGLLEKAGLNISWALNIPCIISFFFLLTLIYFLAKLLFKNRLVAFLSVFFFLFNGTFSFIEFFKNHPPLSGQFLKDFLKVEQFPSFGPYDGKVVSAFWNLNIYTNQRHFAPALALILMICFLFLKDILAQKKISVKKVILLALCFSILPFFHAPVFGMGLIIFGSFFILFPSQRRPLLAFLGLSFLLGLPQIISLKQGPTAQFLTVNPGYLIAGRLTPFRLFYYWFLNLGLNFFFIPIGFLLSPRPAKKIFLSFLPLFLIANIFQFSPEMAANHKFFNLWLIVADMFTAYALFKMWKRKGILKLVVPAFIFFLTLSGIIDFLAIKNDFYYKVSNTSQDVVWIKNNIPPSAVVLNSSFLYHPASLAGRKIFMGWPYFPWSFGFNTAQREREIRDTLSSNNLETICLFSQKHKILYAALDKPSDSFPFDPQFWDENFSKVYENSETGLTIFLIRQSCSQFLN